MWASADRERAPRLAYGWIAAREDGAAGPAAVS